ncbi:MAG: exosortase/archaeosortase family protein [Candidatus Nealsonbacteria bacterium]|nr:exosortase/archaeosortase family protein [Candidatus Nealsonbacteria bacterium]
MKPPTSRISNTLPVNSWPLLAWVVLAGLVAWSYGEALGGSAHRWWNEPDYLYGFLVAPFAVFLLWRRRDMFQPTGQRGSWWGLVLLALAAAIRCASAYFNFALLEPLSLIPCLAGIVLLVGGWWAMRWTWPSIVFLVFMVPLPGFLAEALSHPLQRVGTIVGTYVIQGLGIPSVARGNVIILSGGTELGVAEVCSGLRMLMLFAAVCTGAALMSRRNAIEKAVIILSAVPIAVFANVTRIAVTATLYAWASDELAKAVFHDLAAFLMLPMAFLLLCGEMLLLDKLFLDPEPEGPMPIRVTTETASDKI